MSKLKVVHLAPSNKFKTGIASYADLVDRIFARYMANEIEVHRVTPKEYLEALDCSDNLVVLAQIGSNEGDVFRVLRKQLRIMPSVRRIIEIHDPPHLVLSYITILDHLAASLPGRAVRRVFDWLFGDRYVRTFVAPLDVFVCKTEAGCRALRERFRRLKIKAQVICIELSNYLDAPLDRLSCSDVVPTIGFFGYIHPDKGIHVLINAAIHLHASHGIASVPRILIRGSLASPQCKNYLEEMKRKVREAGLVEKIDFGGFVPFEELPSFVTNLTAVALPYMINTRSSASGPLLWARTCCIPVLAHRTTVFESFVLDGIDGELIGIGNLDDWVKVMEKVATDPGWAKKLSPGTKACLDRGSWRVVSTQFREVLGLPLGVNQ